MFKPTILIDFDQTITTQRGFAGPPRQEAVDAINTLKDKYRIVIFSCRANRNVCPVSDDLLLQEYLKNYQIYHDEICTRKPVFFALIDDRCYNPNDKSWDDIVNDLIKKAL